MEWHMIERQKPWSNTAKTKAKNNPSFWLL